MAITEPLTRELEAFEAHRQEWSGSNLGKFVVIQDDSVLDGFFDTYADAFKTGLQQFGVSRTFLVKQIWIKEPVYFIA